MIELHCGTRRVYAFQQTLLFFFFFAKVGLACETKPILLHKVFVPSLKGFPGNPPLLHPRLFYLSAVDCLRICCFQGGFEFTDAALHVIAAAISKIIYFVRVTAVNASRWLSRPICHLTHHGIGEGR